VATVLLREPRLSKGIVSLDTRDTQSMGIEYHAKTFLCPRRNRKPNNPNVDVATDVEFWK
jgi:hypothetical protein